MRFRLPRCWLARSGLVAPAPSDQSRTRRDQSVRHRLCSQPRRQESWVWSGYRPCQRELMSHRQGRVQSEGEESRFGQFQIPTQGVLVVLGFSKPTARTRSTATTGRAANQVGGVGVSGTGKVGPCSHRCPKKRCRRRPRSASTGRRYPRSCPSRCLSPRLVPESVVRLALALTASGCVLAGSRGILVAPR
jgi:hypothetical protein